MRRFDYLHDYTGMSIAINSYLNELKKELSVLIDVDNNPLYEQFIQMIDNFEKKYPNLYDISSKILDDLLTPENVEYCIKNKEYKADASKTGCEFQLEIQKIFELEEQLKQIALYKFKEDITNFDEIVNGKDFIVVGHASDQLPGLPGDDRYNRFGQKRYLSCSLLSNLELNTFQDSSIFFVVDVKEDNYLLGTYYDTVTRENRNPSVYTVGEIESEDGKLYIDAGYSNDKDKFAISIATPKVIEKLSVEREIKDTGRLYDYNNTLTNEIILDRDKTSVKGCLLVAEETKVLFSEFYTLEKNNMDFKCINKGLYKEKQGIDRYDKTAIPSFKKQLKESIDYYKNILKPEEFSFFLSEYYKKVVRPMNYSDDILSIINEEFNMYINTETIYKKEK